MPAFLIPLLLNRYTIGFLLIAGLVTGAYFKGRWTAEANCHEAELRAQIATMKRDLAAWKAADEVEKILQSEVEAERRDLQEKVTEYEIELALRPDTRCTLDGSDVERLRGIGWR